MTLWFERLWMAAVLVLALASAAAAQAPPPPAWTGSLGAGLALTGGNASTATTNLAFTAESDRTRRNVVRVEGLNIRSTRDGDAIVDRTNFQAEDDFFLTPRTFAFGRLQYLRDVFKGIDYLLSPSAGFGYRVVESEVATLVADLALGVVTEKNPGVDPRSAAALTAGQKAMRRISDTATVTQSFTALFSMEDFGDSLLTFQAGLATDITPRTQLKVDFLDAYKNRPPSVLVKKNDTALVVSFVFTF